jgi:hypothetical protein
MLQFLPIAAPPAKQLLTGAEPVMQLGLSNGESKVE